MTVTMNDLAGGKLDVEVPGIGRRDEIGEMAKAVEVFKSNAVARRAWRPSRRRRRPVPSPSARRTCTSWPTTSRARSARSSRRCRRPRPQLEASAGTLTSTAERAEELATTVAAASEEASTNVQSVASATEEMASSVNEISRQVQESARMAGEAVDQARKTNDRVGELSKAAARIGDVVELINTIAGPDQPAGAQRHHRGGARRRGGPRLRRGGFRGEGAGRADREGDRRDRPADHRHPGRDAGIRSSAIKEISGTIEKLSEISSTIAAAVEEQGAATQEISRNVQQAAHGTQQVSSNITDVQRGAGETGVGLVAGAVGGAVAVGRQQPPQAGSRQVPRHGARGLAATPFNKRSVNNGWRFGLHRDRPIFVAPCWRHMLNRLFEVVAVIRCTVVDWSNLSIT